MIPILLVAGCRKEFDHPPYKPVAANAGLSISQLKLRISGLSMAYRFGTGDTNLYCTVTADESSGNFYKQVFVRDAEGNALQLKLKHAGGLYAGDEIRVNLNGLYLTYVNSALSLDSIDISKSVVKISSGNSVAGLSVKLQDVLRYTNDPLNAASLQSQLVELNGVEFLPQERGKFFGDPVSKNTVKHTLIDCQGRELQLSTSGFANFAGKPVPPGSGRLTGIVTQYNNSVSLCLRNYYDVQMNNSPCTSGSVTTTTTPTFVLPAATASLSENFDNAGSGSEFAQAGWINMNESGNVKWKGHVKNVSYHALKASSYGSGETNTIWLIAPPALYHANTTISFKTGIEFGDKGHPQPIMAYISNDFNGSNFKTANWTVLAASYAAYGDENYSGSAGLKSSGEIKLSDISIFSGYTGSFSLAFRYSGNAVYDSNIYLDDVVVK
jgi:hypothetical protein